MRGRELAEGASQERMSGESHPWSSEWSLYRLSERGMDVLYVYS